MQRLANPLFLKVFSNGCRRIAFCCVVLVTVAGCALLHPEPKLEAPEVGGFAVKGRMAVRNGDDGFTSSFVWQHAVGRDEIDLWGPLGQGHSRLVGEGDAVTVYTAKGEVYHEHDADAAMQRWLGFSLPMIALTHWIRGERAPGYPVEWHELRCRRRSRVARPVVVAPRVFRLPTVRRRRASAGANRRGTRRR